MKDTNKVAIPLIINSKGQYLLVTRTEFPDHNGEWAPIAGHIQNGEIVEKALIREAKEELNLAIQPIKQLAVLSQDVLGDIGYWWECELIGGEIQTNSEIESYKFFTREEIKKINLWPATRKFFEEYVWSK